MKPEQDPTMERYLNGDYAEMNPDWDAGDAPWKARKVAELLAKNACNPISLVEVGCGSGAVLEAMRKFMPDVEMAGFDIAPDAERFWSERIALNIRLEVGDYFSLNEPVPDVILVLDVLEHLGNPWEFLVRMRESCRLAVFHFPLDLSALSVLRESPLLHVRNKVGHLHYFTRGLALKLLEESGFEIVDACYTAAFSSAPQRSMATKVMGFLRKLVFFINYDVGVRLLGGETLMVLARPKGKE